MSEDNTAAQPQRPTLDTTTMRLLCAMPGPLVLAEVVPEAAIGMVDHTSGCVITDPNQSSCGRFDVDPLETYGITLEQSNALKLLNLTIEQAVDAGLDEMCRQVQERLGVASGDLAGAWFSEQSRRAYLSDMLGGYALAEIRLAGGK